MADIGDGITPEDGGIILLTPKTMDAITLYGSKKVELPKWVRVQHFPPLPDDWGGCVINTTLAGLLDLPTW